MFDGLVVSFVIKAVIKGWQQEADKVGVTILVEDSTQGCLIKVKHFNLDMILNTLMASALIRSDANQIIHLSAKLYDGRLRISIEDTGEGVSEEEIQAFEAQEFGLAVIEHKFTLSDTSLSAIAQMAEHSGGHFDFHYNQLTHKTRVSISWPIENCIPSANHTPAELAGYTKPSERDQAQRAYSTKNVIIRFKVSGLIKFISWSKNITQTLILVLVMPRRCCLFRREAYKENLNCYLAVLLWTM